MHQLKIDNKEFFDSKPVIDKNLEKDLIQGLKIRYIEDRDLHSLTIWCNPNHILGPDYEIEEKLSSLLKFLIRNQIVVRERSPQGRDIFTLIKSKNIQKN